MMAKEAQVRYLEEIHEASDPVLVDAEHPLGPGFEDVPGHGLGEFVAGGAQVVVGELNQLQDQQTPPASLNVLMRICQTFRLKG